MHFFNVDFIMYINFYLGKVLKLSIFEKKKEERNVKIIQIKKFYADCNTEFFTLLCYNFVSKNIIMN